LECFGEVLKVLRRQNGHSTAKSFYNYLVERGLDCNYQYYMKIEKNQAFPSSGLVNQMAKAMDSESSQKLVLAYCTNQFKSFDFLFKPPRKHFDNQVKEAPYEVAQGQRELSILQVMTLSRRQENYFLFLLLTLSRGPISKREIEQYDGLLNSIVDLEKCGIAFTDGEFVSSTSSEFRFPVVENVDVNSAYSLFDNWDLEFSSQFDFEKMVNKMMIRRISPRYLSAIRKQIDTISDFVRLSDEADQKHNNDVLHLQIKLSHGEIPG